MSYYQDANMYSSSSGGNNGNEFSSALSHAQSNQSEQSSDHPLFNAALSFLDSRKSQYSEPANYDVDEDKYLRAHNSLYNSGSREDEDEHDSDSLGAGAAMQALKQFTSGGEKDAGGGGGFDKNRLIGMAMSQAGRLWEEKNGAGKASGDKQSAINSAAETALKMYMKSQGGGIGGTGGPSGLLGLATKFLS